jgi:hypothetical protein
MKNAVFWDVAPCLKNRGLIPDKAGYISLRPTSRLALETAYSPIQSVPEAHFPGVIAAGT